MLNKLFLRKNLDTTLVKGPVDHRDQDSDVDAQAEFQDEGNCGHEGKDCFDYRARLGNQETPEDEASL